VETVCATIAATSASSAILQRTAIALWPPATSCSAAERAASSWRSASETAAPASAKALAVARPIPEAAPVTSATLSANAKVMIYVDLDAQQMTVIKNNGETHVWKVSSGREGFETPTGLFSVQRLDVNHFSDEYDQSPMPYSIFFAQGLAIHGTNQGGL
jgi:lipoprotein-anchoring transpeptidase ErfK/SrfK